jgi:hypothetical protein
MMGFAALNPSYKRYKRRLSTLRHGEERSDEAIHSFLRGKMDCFASLAMTVATTDCQRPPILVNQAQIARHISR